MDTHTPLTVIELRRYRTQLGRRDELIALFEREFIESQEAVGMRLPGLFREPAEPDRFTWLRGFADMASRAAGLKAFYFGPVWQDFRNAANATIVDSDDVLLLRPSPGLPALAPAERAASPRPWRAIVLPLAEPAGDDLRAWIDTHWLSSLRQAGAEDLGVFETEFAENNFPRLPVRTDGPVLMLLAAWPGGASVPGLDTLAPWLRAEPLVLQLEPTARSACA
ncbi:MAG TPA: NIPSNAP family protein [Ideonella sp.]|uniref:NIPSNAP family protein n=1 Tax=Ideonella sp. TaxID=1929293 RepID=UPI002E3294D6|nr:NIPSNAP family protein [Ideonella sp.]HEX5682850.1 NIPSNAP family protein [Ideonella sp.]